MLGRNLGRGVDTGIAPFVASAVDGSSSGGLWKKPCISKAKRGISRFTPSKKAVGRANEVCVIYAKVSAY